MPLDVIAGMTLSNGIMYFIILTAGATLHRAGLTDVQTAQQAAEALRPISGPLSSVLFAAGIVGTGMLGVPVLAGSAAYAVAEARGWARGDGSACAGRAAFLCADRHRHGARDSARFRAPRPNPDAVASAVINGLRAAGSS